MFVRPNLTRPGFLIPYTDWDLDTDVSLCIHEKAMIEKGITKVSSLIFMQDDGFVLHD